MPLVIQTSSTGLSGNHASGSCLARPVAARLAATLEVSRTLGDPAMATLPLALTRGYDTPTTSSTRRVVAAGTMGRVVRN